MVDAFTANWSKESNWWCSSGGLISQVVEHAQMFKATCIVTVPEWLSAWFRPVLHPSADNLADLEVDMQELPLSESLILLGLSGFSLFAAKSLTQGSLPCIVISHFRGCDGATWTDG